MSTEEEVTRLAGLISGGCNTEDSAWYILETNIVIDKAELPKVTGGADGLRVDGVDHSFWLPATASADKARQEAFQMLAIAEALDQWHTNQAANRKRRDEVARELLTSTYGEDSPLVGYAGCIAQMQNAIDRIIELEQKS